MKGDLTSELEDGWPVVVPDGNWQFQQSSRSPVFHVANMDDAVGWDDASALCGWEPGWDAHRRLGDLTGHNSPVRLCRKCLVLANISGPRGRSVVGAKPRAQSMKGDLTAAISEALAAAPEGMTRRALIAKLHNELAGVELLALERLGIAYRLDRQRPDPPLWFLG